MIHSLCILVQYTALSAPKPVYDDFEHNVRQEYRMVPGFIYRKKRKELLQTFLARDYLYHLGYFQDKYEQTARKNIQSALQKL
jgi:Uncharacterized protein conserved in bacteria